jgi:hypothetical protein
LLQALELAPSSRHRRTSSLPLRSQVQLGKILRTLEFYEEKIRIAGSTSAVAALRVVATELEKDGLHDKQDQPPEELP